MGEITYTIIKEIGYYYFDKALLTIQSIFSRASVSIINKKSSEKFN